MTALASALLMLIVTVGHSATAGAPSAGETCDASRHPEQPVTRLRNDLFCGYDRLERPALDHRNATNVSVLVWLKSIDVHPKAIVVCVQYDHSHGTVGEIQAWTVWTWKDEYLTWKPKEHDGISLLHVDSSSIWVPDVVLQTPTEFQLLESFMERGRCLLQSGGNVACVASGAYYTACPGELDTFPFDRRTCEMTLHAMRDSRSNNILLDFINIGFSAHEYVPHREWQLLNVTAAKLTNQGVLSSEEVALVYKFAMKRHAAVYASTILASTAVVVIMTAASFWINPQSLGRLSLCCMNIFIHCLYLQHLQYTIGSGGDKCPRIVLFFRDSMMLTMASLVLAVVALRLSFVEGAPPERWSRAAHWLLDTGVGRALLSCELSNKVSASQGTGGDEEAANIIDNSENVTVEKNQTYSWLVLLQLTDRILFGLFTVALVIIMMARLL